MKAFYLRLQGRLRYICKQAQEAMKSLKFCTQKSLMIWRKKLGREFSIHAYGVGDGKEEKLKGRYYEKAVDIAVFKEGIECAGVAVKFVMSNYAQNANNYFAKRQICAQRVCLIFRFSLCQKLCHILKKTAA